MRSLFVLLAVFGLSTVVSGQNTTLSVVGPLPTDPLIVLPDTTFGASVLLEADADVQGWSFGVCQDEAFFTIDSVANGSTTQTVNNGDLPDFNEVALLSGGVTVGVVINFTGAAVLPPGVGYELLTMQYTTVPGLMQPLPGDPPITTQIAHCDTLGNPPVATVVVVNGGSLVPTQNPLNIAIPAPPECNLVCVGGVDFVDLTWNDCNPGAPADYFLLFRDGVLLNVFDDGTQNYVDPGLAPGTYTYSLVAVSFPDPQGAPSILSGICTVDVIPVTLAGIDPVSGLYQGGTELTITGTGFLAAMDTTVLIGGTTALDIVVVDDSTITCTTPAVDFVGPVDVEVVNTFGDDLLPDGFLYGFRRGLVNNDSSIDIADPVFALTYLFMGGAAPFCLDAAEANDDGILDIADPIYILNYLLMGMPVPPPPFAEPGLDPTTEDPYGCGNPPPMP